MAKGTLLKPGTENAINARVDRILRDLDYLEPPLRLEDVREMLRLDLQHYSSTNVSWLEERIHEIKVAGKQVLARPTLMLDVVRKLKLKALILPDRKRILVDEELPAPKQRWSEAHEITHDVLPWHDGVAMGDQARTLSITCHRQIEAEANYGAGRLLFLGNRFGQQLADEADISFETVKALKSIFGNSMTTTLWRIVENLDMAAFGLVSIHPQEQAEPGQGPIRYFIRSRAFEEQFPNADELFLFGCLRAFCFGRRGPIGQGEVVLSDASGASHVFRAEAFNNHHDTLTLATYRTKRHAQVAMP